MAWCGLSTFRMRVAKSFSDDIYTSCIYVLLTQLANPRFHCGVTEGFRLLCGRVWNSLDEQSLREGGKLVLGTFTLGRIKVDTKESPVRR